MSRLAPTSLLLAALLSAGCFPNVVWLPDSSAIVFTEARGKRLVRYDLKAKSRLVLVEDTKALTPWLAISPDGKRLAVATWQRQKNQPSQLQVALFNTSGAELWRSTSFAWLPSGQNDDLEDTLVFWPTKDRLLVVAKDTALYDLRKDTLVRLESVQPFLATGLGRPDGQGFLAFRKIKDGEELAFVDWQGKVKPIPGELSSEKEGFPFGFALRWEKDTAILSGPTMTLRADTATGKLTRDTTAKLAVLPAKGTLVFAHAFGRARTLLCLFGEEKEVQPGQMESFNRVELHCLAPKKRQLVVLDRCSVIPIPFPSPDGKMVALRYYPDKDISKILIVDSSGKKLADFQTDE